MQKNKYQRATKEEKLAVKKDFFNTEYGVSLKVRLNRLLIYSILLFACAIYFFVDNYLNSKSTVNYITVGFMIIFAIIFLWGRYYVIIKSLNSFMLENKKKK